MSQVSVRGSNFNEILSRKGPAGPVAPVYRRPSGTSIIRLVSKSRNNRLSLQCCGKCENELSQPCGKNRPVSEWIPNIENAHINRKLGFLLIDKMTIILNTS